MLPPNETKLTQVTCSFIDLHLWIFKTIERFNKTQNTLPAIDVQFAFGTKNKICLVPKILFSAIHMLIYYKTVYGSLTILKINSYEHATSPPKRERTKFLATKYLQKFLNKKINKPHNSAAVN